MKKRILGFILIMCLFFPCAFVLTGCGEQFIEERTYNLLGTTVIKDNTTAIYRPFDDGQYATSFCGDMKIEDCTIQVGRKTCLMVYENEATGIRAVFQFSVYTGAEVYPAYEFRGSSITINGEEASNLTETEIASLPQDVAALYTEVKQFATICGYGESSIQLVTQNKSFACHIVMSDRTDGSLLFMAMLFGY